MCRQGREEVDLHDKDGGGVDGRHGIEDSLVGVCEKGRVVAARIHLVVGICVSIAIHAVSDISQTRAGAREWRAVDSVTVTRGLGAGRMV